MILIVHDEQHVGTVLSQLLSFAGYAATTAVNGEQAIRLVKQYRPTLILRSENARHGGFQFLTLQRELPRR